VRERRDPIPVGSATYWRVGTEVRAQAPNGARTHNVARTNVPTHLRTSVLALAQTCAASQESSERRSLPWPGRRLTTSACFLMARSSAKRFFRPSARQVSSITPLCWSRHA
jgi:hypothetical protein